MLSFPAALLTGINPEFVLEEPKLGSEASGRNKEWSMREVPIEANAEDSEEAFTEETLGQAVREKGVSSQVIRGTAFQSEDII